MKYDNRKIDIVTIMFFILLFSITSIVFVGAAEIGTVSIDDVFTKGTIRYSKPCFFNDTYCSATAACNITIFYSNKSVLVANQLMTNNGYEHNITFNTNTSGIYTANMICLDGGYWGSNTFYFEVNPTGIINTDEKTSITNMSIYFFFILGIIFFISSFFIKKLPVKLSLVIGAIWLFLITLTMVNVSISSEVLNPQVIDFLDGITAISFYLYWGLASVFIVMWILTFFNTYFGNQAQNKLSKYGG